MSGEVLKWVARSSGLDGVDDAGELGAENAHRVVQRRENRTWRTVLVRRGGGRAHEGEGSVPDIVNVLDAHCAADGATAATENVAMLRRKSIMLLSDVAGEPGHLGTGAVAVDGRVLPGLRAVLCAHVSLVALDHVRPDAEREVESADQFSDYPVDAVVAVLASTETPLQRLNEATVVHVGRRKVEGESRTRSLIAAMEVEMGRRYVALFCAIDVRPLEEGVGRDVAVDQLADVHEAPRSHVWCGPPGDLEVVGLEAFGPKCARRARPTIAPLRQPCQRC